MLRSFLRYEVRLFPRTDCRHALSRCCVTILAKEKSYFPLSLSLCLPHFLIAYPALRSSHIHVALLGISVLRCPCYCKKISGKRPRSIAVEGSRYCLYLRPICRLTSKLLFRATSSRFDLIRVKFGLGNPPFVPWVERPHRISRDSGKDRANAIPIA